MDFWIIFWTLIIILGIGSFVVLVVTVIPLGGKDVLELMRRLGSDEPVIPKRSGERKERGMKN